MVISNSTWAHKKAGYVVVAAELPYEVVKQKDPNDARWQLSVAYRKPEEPSILLVRTEKDFLEKFVHLSDDPEYWARREAVEQAAKDA